MPRLRDRVADHAGPGGSVGAGTNMIAGAGWLMLSAATFATIGAIVKVAGEGVPGVQLGFLRYLFGFLTIVPIAMIWRAPRLRSPEPGRHAVRAACGLGAVTCWLHAVTHLPLATAAAINFSSPLFAMVLAVLVLREPSRAAGWIAGACCMLGVLIVVRPSAGFGDSAAMIALLGAVFVAGEVTMIRMLAQAERPVVILLYVNTIACVAGLLPALSVWVWPSPAALALIAMVGPIAIFGQICTVLAFQRASPAAISPFSYTNLLFATAWGWILFGAVPDFWTVVGALIIVASAWWLSTQRMR